MVLPVPEGEPRPAWDDVVDAVVRGKGGRYRLRVEGLRADLDGVVRGRGDGDGGAFVSLPGYEALDVQPGMGDEEFRLAAQCLVNFGTPDEGLVGGGRAATDGACLFLYEVCAGSGGAGIVVYP